uniref:GNAT family N-acetyltransferase n=1 Tax=Actibacterium sp. TaxID=1872125 RepID=UPI0035627CC2
MPQIRRALPPYDWNAVLRLIRASFAYMEGRIDPPSALHRLTAQDIAAQSESAEIWVIEENNAPVACVFLTPRDDVLYLGKLAVAQTHRGR